MVTDLKSNACVITIIFYQLIRVALHFIEFETGSEYSKMIYWLGDW